MSNELDARLHGHRGAEECDREAVVGKEYPTVTRMLLDRHELLRKIREWEPGTTNADSIDPESMIQEYAEAYHRAALASNPSPEPEETPQQRFEKKLDDLKDDPDFLREKIAILEGEVAALSQPVEDAEVEEAIAFFNGLCETGPFFGYWQTIRTALRSQAGQGRVVTPAQMKAIVEKWGVTREDGSLTFDGEAMAADVNALLAAQEKVTGDEETQAALKQFERLQWAYGALRNGWLTHFGACPVDCNCPLSQADAIVAQEPTK